MDRITKSTHFLLVRTTDTVKKLAKLYVKEIVRLHGISISIMSDCDARFTSALWKQLQAELGTQLKFSTASHPQTDGQSERTIQTLEDMLRACVMDFPRAWDEKVALIEFAYNNSYHTSIGMSPYELLYDKKCRSPIHWHEAGERKYIRVEEVDQASKDIELVKKRL